MLSSLPPIRPILAVALLTAVAAGVLLLLAWMDLIAFSAALSGAGGILVAGSFGLRLYRRDLDAVASYVAQLAAGEGDTTIPPSRQGSPGVRRLNAGIARLHQKLLFRQAGLREEAHTHTAILDAMHDPLILLDGERKVVRANAAARTLFGEGMVERDLSAGLRNPDVLEAVDAVLHGGAARSLEFILTVPVERVFQIRVMPFRHAVEGMEGEGRVDQVLLTLHDITSIKRSEQSRADFIANASHELRTPLASLIGFIETLRGPARDDPDAHERFLGIMQDQAGRMSRLVDDLLSLSRIEQDEHSPPDRHEDVAALIRGVIASLELKARERGMTIRLEVPDSLPAVVGDGDQLAQVFQNLIHNAVKYGREGTEVTVSVRVTEPASRTAAPTVIVAVKDRGEGIPRSHLPRLTERFYRVDPARSRALGGTGLGLAIVKHIVNRHRGRLTIESQVGQGSTFSVHLPAAGKEAGRMRA